MGTRVYEVKATGLTPLLMHCDSVEHADAMEEWKNDPANKKISRAGDDRTPAFRWLGYLWHDGVHVGIPSEALGSAFLSAGKNVTVPGGRSGKTFKAQSQSGMSIRGTLVPVLVAGKPIKVADLEPLRTENDFSVHQNWVRDLGFSLFVKRATVGTSKHIRVRPRFDDWALKFEVEVWDEQITGRVVDDFVRIAGATVGLGDWRPSAPKKPGPFGRFDGTCKEVK